MNLETVLWHIKSGLEQEIEAAFFTASEYLCASRGYRSHRLQRCLEHPNHYLLLVEWETLEDHTVGFQGSERYARYRALLKPYYEPDVSLLHYAPVLA